MNPKKPSDLSDEYWGRLSDEHKRLYAIVRPQTKATYEVDVHIANIESFLAKISQDLKVLGGKLELEPDFQRGHVWTDGQRIKYVESLLRGCAPRTIFFNCPGWSGIQPASATRVSDFECVDGLQRLTAVRKFMAGEIKVFGGLSAEDLKGSPFSPNGYTLRFAVFELPTRSELLQFYLDLNSGGTVHASDEIERVRALLDEASSPA